MAKAFKKHRKHTLAVLLLVPVLAVVGVLSWLLPAYGNGQLTERSLQLSDSIPGHMSNYEIAFTIQDPDDVGSLKIEFCSNSPLEAEVCTQPSGLDANSATLTQSNGFIDMSILSQDDNSVVLTRPATPVAPPLTVIFTLNGVRNPSALGTYYMRIATYGSTDATGPRISFGGLAFAMSQSVDVNTVVPPYLIACTGLTITNFDCANAQGSYLNFGNVSTKTAGSGQSQLLLATNAPNGYSVYASGPTMTSGNNTIPPLQNADVSRPGTSQFGINLRANSDPAVGAEPSNSGPTTGSIVGGYGTPNQYKYASGDMVATGTGVEADLLYTMSYLVNISTSQPAGVYSTTMLYTALANF